MKGRRRKLKAQNYEEYLKLVEENLLPMLSGLGSIPERLKNAMCYSLEAGGKRIRPVLLLAACEMAGGSCRNALPYACALEMIHTYSLIHDDLPAMDNDDLRRGKPTNHRVFGEDMAILAGDGLLNAAAELMANTAAKSGDIRGVQAMASIMMHAGVTGMIAGQTADISATGQKADPDTLTYIHTHKTADLLMAAMEAGIILGGAGKKEIASASEYAYHIGMAFQMTDDLLDVTGQAEMMGKNPHADAEADKMTWVSLKGIEGTRQDAEREIMLANKALEKLPYNTEFFAAFAGKIIGRNH